MMWSGIYDLIIHLHTSNTHIFVSWIATFFNGTKTRYIHVSNLNYDIFALRHALGLKFHRKSYLDMNYRYLTKNIFWGCSYWMCGNRYVRSRVRNSTMHSSLIRSVNVEWHLWSSTSTHPMDIQKSFCVLWIISIVHAQIRFPVNMKK